MAMLLRKHHIVICLTVLLLLASVNCYAQKQKVQNLPNYDYKKYHFGFTLGFNTMNFVVKKVKNFDQLDSVFIIEPVPQSGFNIGIVSNKRLTEYLDLRFVPTLSFGDRSLRYSVRVADSVVAPVVKKIESTYIDFPFTLKYKSKRVNNFRAYLLGGGRYSLDLASQSAKKSQNEDLLKLYANDISMELGVGFDFYLLYFKFGTEIKMAYGFRDLLKREGNIYTQGIDKLSSKIFWLTFTFE